MLPGFYGGVMLRDATVGSSSAKGLNLYSVPSAWARYALPGSEAAPTQSLMFAGYRFGNKVAVEAAAGEATSFALRLGDRMPAGMLGATPGLAFNAPRSWNLDVYTSYPLYNSFALYGRVGYLQNDPAPVAVGVAGAGGVNVQSGVNYGLGVRYDFSSALGLKLEYARFARYGFSTSFSGPFPDSDQVRLGVQYRF